MQAPDFSTFNFQVMCKYLIFKFCFCNTWKSFYHYCTRCRFCYQDTKPEPVTENQHIGINPLIPRICTLIFGFYTIKLSHFGWFSGLWLVSYDLLCAFIGWNWLIAHSCMKSLWLTCGVKWAWFQHAKLFLFIAIARY